MNAQQLYQQTKYKTRVVILASNTQNCIPKMVLHVMEYYNRNVDFVLANGERDISENNEFVVIETSEDADSYKANIALICDVNPNIQTAAFINSITNGGMLVYNEEIASVKLLVEANKNPIKKYPYQAPNFNVKDNVFYLDTDEGELPLEITNENDVKNILGVKWICQHMGVDEDDFYEALVAFEG